jgi:hypothetical protein
MALSELAVRRFQPYGTATGPLSLMWGGYVLLCICCWLHWRETGFPIGSFWWDELALSGGSEAINQGLLPDRDFWAPFILPVYLKWFAQHLVGPARSFMVECMLQGGLVLSIFSMMVAGKRQPTSIYMVGVAAVVMASFPFNIGSGTQAALGLATYCGAYNRLGGAFLTLIFVYPITVGTPMVSNCGRDIAWVSGLFILSYLVKITAFQVVSTFLVLASLVINGRHWPLLLIRASAVFLGMLFLSWLFLDMGPGYVKALADISKVRAGFIGKNAELMISLFFSYHYLEMFFFLMIGVLFVLSRGLVGAKWGRWIVLYLIAGMGVVGYTLTNFGDNGLFPFVGAAALLICAPVSSPSKPEKEREHYSRLLTSCMVGINCLLFGIYLAMNLFWGWSLLSEGEKGSPNPVPVSTSFFNKNYVVSEADWSSRPRIDVPGASFNVAKAGPYVSYIEGLQEVVAYLELNYPQKLTSVYALDYPAYVLSVVSGYRIPKGTYPWLLYGHELNADFYPEPAILFSDVDILLTSKCSLAGGNRRKLLGIYKNHIESNWAAVHEFRCWTLHRPRRAN